MNQTNMNDKDSLKLEKRYTVVSKSDFYFSLVYAMIFFLWGILTLKHLIIDEYPRIVQLTWFEDFIFTGMFLSLSIIVFGTTVIRFFLERHKAKLWKRLQEKDRIISPYRDDSVVANIKIDKETGAISLNLKNKGRKEQENKHE